MLEKLLSERFNKESFSILQVRDKFEKELEPLLPNKGVGFVAPGENTPEWTKDHNQNWRKRHENVQWLMGELDKLCSKGLIKKDTYTIGYFSWVVKDTKPKRQRRRK